MALLYIDKVKDNQAAFEQKVIDIAKKLAFPQDALMFIMNVETGGTFDPSIQNTAYPIQGGYATGLIQFAPNTAKELGTTTDQLKSMNAIDQLDYVYEYFKKYAGRVNDPADIYMIVFFPAALGKSDSEYIESSDISADTVAASNPAFDLNKDGKITVGEFREWVNSKLPAGYTPDPQTLPTKTEKVIARTKAYATTNWWKLIIVIALLGLLYWIFKKAFLSNK